jgi:5,10-methenyltetrahydromethanopterin hydrogenase
MMLQQLNNLPTDTKSNGTPLYNQDSFTVIDDDNEDIIKFLINAQSEGLSDIYKRIQDTIMDEGVHKERKYS